MNIKILDSWLREFLKTNATPEEIAKDLSLTSVSIERIEKYKDDFVYDIEVTTNRPDLASVTGLAREAAAVLPQFGMSATYIPPLLNIHPETPLQNDRITIDIINDPTLINRITAVVMEVTVEKSPDVIKERLETSGIRSLNNLIDITNYVMRTIGHPAHVFDFDRLATQKLKIRKSKKGETIVTLDKKHHVLPGGDIVAENDEGVIVDLLGIMGLENSVVTSTTKRILFFLDNNDPAIMRKTSMSLGIRSEAVQLNEKGIDPELAMDALRYGISLYEKFAKGRIISEIIDIYPHPIKEKMIRVTEEKINTVIGVPIPLPKAKTILEDLGFTVSVQNTTLTVTIPSLRVLDIDREEDIIEEIARIYGYHNLPSVLPPVTSATITQTGIDIFSFEKRVKQAMKYWGYTETYTYASVSETVYEGPIADAVTIKNPLDEDHLYMRATLVPSLLAVLKENKAYKTVRIFEIANVYTKNGNDLPNETRMMAGVLRQQNASFFEIKGLIEQLCYDLGIKNVDFKQSEKGGIGASLFLEKDYLGDIEILDETTINFEINFEIVTKHATLKKTYTPLSKFPPIIEDFTFTVSEKIATGDVIAEIKKQSPLIVAVTLLDKYKQKRTFHVLFQDSEKNLTNEQVGEIRTRIIISVAKKFKAQQAS